MLLIAATGAQAPTDGATARQPEPKRNGCERLFTRHQFREYAREQFHERTYDRREHRRVRARARCQRTDRNERWAWAKRKEMRAARYHRINRLCGTTTCNGRLLGYMAKRRWNEVQASCLKALSWRESGWDEKATNGSSGAFGLPQALPGSKMRSHGADWWWNPVTQIRWMMDYVVGVYGSACNANSHQIANNSY